MENTKHTLTFSVNDVTRMATAWANDEAGHRCMVARESDGLFHWHTTKHGREGEPIAQGNAATSKEALTQAARALGFEAYRLT